MRRRILLPFGLIALLVACHDPLSIENRPDLPVPVAAYAIHEGIPDLMIGVQASRLHEIDGFDIEGAGISYSNEIDQYLPYHPASGLPQDMAWFGMPCTPSPPVTSSLVARSYAYRDHDPDRGGPRGEPWDTRWLSDPSNRLDAVIWPICE